MRSTATTRRCRLASVSSARTRRAPMDADCSSSTRSRVPRRSATLRSIVVSSEATARRHCSFEIGAETIFELGKLLANVGFDERGDFVTQAAEVFVDPVDGRRGALFGVFHGDTQCLEALIVSSQGAFRLGVSRDSLTSRRASSRLSRWARVGVFEAAASGFHGSELTPAARLPENFADCASEGPFPQPRRCFSGYGSSVNHRL